MAKAAYVKKPPIFYARVLAAAVSVDNRPAPIKPRLTAIRKPSMTNCAVSRAVSLETILINRLGNYTLFID